MSIPIIIALLVCLSWLVYASANMCAQIYVKSQCRLHTHKRYVALTFDDGPDATQTPPVLDLLHARGITATFFVVGNKAEVQPELIRRMVAEGHALGLHSYNHANTFPLLSTRRMTADLQHTHDILQRITGSDIRLFRPPFGVTNPTVRRVVKQLQLQTIGWSVRSLDTITNDINRTMRRIRRQLHPGSIVLLHDKLPNTVALLTQLLELLEKENYTIVPLNTNEP